MTRSRNSGDRVVPRLPVLTLALVSALIGLSGAAGAQTAAPLDILPSAQPAPTTPAAPPAEAAPEAPAPVQPAPGPSFLKLPDRLKPKISEGAAPTVSPGAPASEPAAPAVVKPTVEIARVAAPDPEAIGLIEEADGGFPYDMWRDTPRALVETLLPRLPAGVASPAINRLARRLLLSTAAPPEGPRGRDLVSLRIERLWAMGAGAEANRLLRRAPGDADDQALARVRLDGLLLTADNVGACALARDLVRRGDVPYWDMVLIFCQALSGRHDAAALGVDLLRERGTEPDGTFLALLRAMAGETDIEIPAPSAPTALHLSMLAAARLPVPEAMIDAAGPTLARAIALSAATPLDRRLRAAERAEAMGVLPVAMLADLYRSAAFTAEDLANPLSRAKADPGPLARALLFQSLDRQVVPAARAEVLRALWEAGRASDGWQGFATAARVSLAALASLAPAPELVWIAGDATRALLAAGEPVAALGWYELARSQASVNAEAAATSAELWPLVKIADASGAIPWDDARLEAWWQAREGVPEADRRRDATLLYALLAALGEPVPVAAEAAVFGDRIEQWTRTLVPALWLRLDRASTAGRQGETALLALVAIDPARAGATGSLTLAQTVAALARAGLGDDARAIALEAVLARDL